MTLKQQVVVTKTHDECKQAAQLTLGGHLDHPSHKSVSLSPARRAGSLTETGLEEDNEKQDLVSDRVDAAS